LLIGFNVVCILAALCGAAVVVYAKQTVGQINRVTITRDTIRPADELAPGEPQNFLIVGVDSAARLDPGSPERQGRVSPAIDGVRPDVVMVARVDPTAGEASLLSFPRDLWVNIPGQLPNRINATMAYGEDASPALLVETLKANFDIDINHFVEVDFAGFQSVVNQVGGVPIYLTSPVRDGRSGLNQPEAGCVLFDADQALAYARSRYLQYQDDDGQWKNDGTSDLGRTSRQQEFIRQILRRAIDRGARNPATLARMVETGVQNLRLDEFTTPRNLISLGRAFQNYDPAQLQTDSLPVVEAVRDGAQVLDLVETEAEPILEKYRDEGSSRPDSDPPPSSVSLRVLNGTGTSGEAGLTTDGLAEVGFSVSSPGDEPEGVLRTEVRFPTGEEARALFVARHIDGDPTLVPVEGLGEITVVTGSDLRGVLTDPVAARDVEISAGGTNPEPDDDDTTTSSTVADEEPSAPTQPPGYLPGTPPPGETCG
jgi:LCP family protein required for cell wall assembly